MHVYEIVVYGIVLISNLIIATQWAACGLIETGVQRPISKKAVFAVIMGVLTLTAAGYMERDYGYKFLLFQNENTYQVAGIFLGIPAVWFFLYRYVLMSPGLSYFTRAKIRTEFWMSTGNYQPGKKLNKGNELNDNYFAQQAIRFLNKAAELQKRGSLIGEVTTENKLDLREEGFRKVMIRCPVCGMYTKIPRHLQNYARGRCNLCRASLVVNKENDRLIIKAFSMEKALKPENKLNVARIFVQLSLLHRIMNSFNKALKALDDAEDVIGRVSKDSKTNERKKVEKIIIFRRAEINHALGNIEKAKVGYKKSILEDPSLGFKEEVEAAKDLV